MFEAREPLSSVSEKIVMAHATSGMCKASVAKGTSKAGSSILKILRKCAGLPIALAVTGCAVSFLSQAHGNFESACDVFATRLEMKTSSVGDEETMEGRILNAGIMLSLEFLEVELSKLKAKLSLNIENSISALYSSLCILENQAWVSASVLGRQW